MARPRTMEEIVVRSTARADFNMNLLTTFAVSALLLAGIGMVAAFGLTNVIATFLVGVTARDPAVFVGVPLLLTSVALVGIWLPARRAARVDPVVALRSE